MGYEQRNHSALLSGVRKRKEHLHEYVQMFLLEQKYKILYKIFLSPEMIKPF